MISLQRKQKEALLILFLGVTLMSIVGTQYFAFKIHYNPILKPMFKNIYFPFSVWVWVSKYKLSAPRLINEVSAIMNLFSIVYTGIIYFILIRKSEKDTHGSARFSKDSELKKMELLDCKIPKDLYIDGVILGRTEKGNTVIDNLPTHILMIAPSRSGKGVGVILPTLTNWRHSVICFDVKGENFKKTSLFRKTNLNNKVLRLSPCDPLTNTSYNPLKEVRIRTQYEVKDVEVIALLLVQEEGKKRDHFDTAASSAFSSIILHLLYENPDATMGDIYDFITSPNGSVEDKFTKLLTTTYDSDKNIIKAIYRDSIYADGVHPIIVQGANEILSKSSRERASVISVVINKLLLFKDPIVRRNTSKSDFKLADLLDSETPVSLYFGAELEDLDRLGIYIRVVLTMFMNMSTRTEVHKHKCLMLLDEFPLYGKLETIETALGVIASYGIKIMLIAQNKEQIEKAYGRVNTVKQGCATTVFYAPVESDENTSKLISDILGNKTISYKTSSGKKFGGFLEGSTSIQKKARKLLEPDEVRSKLGKYRNLILISGCNPTLGRKIFYYEETFFKNKILSKEDTENKEKWATLDIIERRRKKWN